MKIGDAVPPSCPSHCSIRRSAATWSTAWLSQRAVGCGHFTRRNLGVANLPGESSGQSEAAVPVGLPGTTLLQGLQGHDRLGIVAIPAHPDPLDAKGGRL